MAETKLKDEEVFKHFNEVRRDSCQIADIKELLTEDKKEKVFAIRKFGGKGIVLHPIGILDKTKIQFEFREEMKKYQTKATDIKKIMLKKQEDWTEEDKEILIGESGSKLLDFDIALITECIKEPPMTREQTNDFLNLLSEDEFNEFMQIASEFIGVNPEDVEKLKNL